MSARASLSAWTAKICPNTLVLLYYRASFVQWRSLRCATFYGGSAPSAWSGLTVPPLIWTARRLRLLLSLDFFGFGARLPARPCLSVNAVAYFPFAIYCCGRMLFSMRSCSGCGLVDLFVVNGEVVAVFFGASVLAADLSFRFVGIDRFAVFWPYGVPAGWRGLRSTCVVAVNRRLESVGWTAAWLRFHLGRHRRRIGDASDRSRIPLWSEYHSRLRGCRHAPCVELFMGKGDMIAAFSLFCWDGVLVVRSLFSLCLWCIFFQRFRHPLLLQEGFCWLYLRMVRPGICLRAGTQSAEAGLSADIRKIRLGCTVITGIAPRSAVTAAWRCTANANPTMCKSVWALKHSTVEGGLCVAISTGWALFRFTCPAAAARKNASRWNTVSLMRFTLCSKRWKTKRRDIVVCGDWNIAHQNIDLKTGKAIRKVRASYRKNASGWARLSTSSVGRICGARFIPMCRATRGGATAGRRMRKMSGGASIIRWLRPNLLPKPCPHTFIKMKIFRPCAAGRGVWLCCRIKFWVNMIECGRKNRNRRSMGCRCVYPAHIGVGDIYVVADARLACADHANPTWALVWLLICMPCLLIASKCLGWKGWRRVVNIFARLTVCAILTYPLRCSSPLPSGTCWNRRGGMQGLNSKIWRFGWCAMPERIRCG